MREECEQALASALGRDLRAGESRDIENAMRLQMRLLARKDPNAWGQLDRAQRLESAAQAAAQQMIGDLALKQRRVQLQIAAHDRIEQLLTDAYRQAPAERERWYQWWRPKQGTAELHVLSRLLAFDAAGQGKGMQSVETLANSINQESLGNLMQLWGSVHGKGIFHLFENERGVSDLVHELFGEHTGNAAAKAGADVWRRTTDELRDRMNAAGGDVGKLDEWHYPQNHSQARIGQAGFEKWMGDILPLLDRSKYMNEDATPFDQNQMERFLNNAYDSIITDGLNKIKNEYNPETGAYAPPGGYGSIADRQNAHRQIFFKDADSYLTYHGQYGDRSLWPTLTGHIRRISRDISLMETLGPNARGTFDYFNNRTRLDARRLFPDHVSDVDQAHALNGALFDYVSGSQAVVNTKVQDAFQSFRNFQTAAKLGGVVLTALSDEAGMASTAFANRIPWAESFARELKYLNPTNGSDREIARNAGLGINGMIGGLNRIGTEDFQLGGASSTGAALGRLARNPLGASEMNDVTTRALANMRNFTSKLATGVLHASGAEGMWDTRRRALGSILMKYLGKWTREVEHFSDINRNDHGMLATKGVSESDWQLWRRAELEDWGMGGTTRTREEPQSGDWRVNADWKQLPPVAPGSVRFFHGGDRYDADGGRWVTEDPVYARDYRSGSNARLQYVDVPETELQGHTKPSYDTTGMPANTPRPPYVMFEAPEDMIKRNGSLKEVPQAPGTPMRTMTEKGGDVLTPKGVMAIPDDKVDEVIKPQIDDIRGAAQQRLDELEARDQKEQDWITKRTTAMQDWVRKMQRRLEFRTQREGDQAGKLSEQLGQIYDKLDAAKSYYATIQKERIPLSELRRSAQQESGPRTEYNRLRAKVRQGIDAAQEASVGMPDDLRARVETERGKIADLEAQGDREGLAEATDRLHQLMEQITSAPGSAETRAQPQMQRMNELREQLRSADDLWARESAFRKNYTQMRDMGVVEGKARANATQLRQQLRELTSGKAASERSQEFQEELERRQGELDEYLDRMQQRANIRDAQSQRIEAGVEPAIDQARVQARRHAASMLLGHVLEEVGMGVMDTGARQRVDNPLLFGIKPGTPAGELMRSVMLFKSFAASMMTKHWARAANMPGPAARAQYAASLAVTGMIMGAIALQLKNLTTGRNPANVAEPRFWAEAAIKGGGLGFYGDFLYDTVTSHDTSWAGAVGGPLYSNIEDIWNLTGKAAIEASQGKRVDEGANVLRFLKGNIPFLNMWYTKAAFDHLLWNNLQEALNPGYLDRMQQRAEMTRGTSWWWDPHEVVPSSAPNPGTLYNPEVGRDQLEAISNRLSLEQ